MPTHRLDIGLGGMSHYVDGEPRGTSGFTRFPDGLRRDRNGGPKKKIVRKPGVGKIIEWESRVRSVHCQISQESSDYKAIGWSRGSKR